MKIITKLVIKLKTTSKYNGHVHTVTPQIPVLLREMDSMLLYKFTCGTCNCTYIGETKRHFQVRSSEHMGISILTNNLLKYNATNATAVRKHCNYLEHDNSVDNIQIVGHASNKFHLRLKESLLISMVSPTIINVQK